jgi:hypothetical protein
MGKYPRKRRLGTEQRQALDLLAGDPHGATEELLVLAHGFDSDMIAGLVRRGFATAQRESMRPAARLKGKAGTELLRPAAEDRLRVWPVSRRVNKTGTGDDDPTLVDEVPA